MKTSGVAGGNDHYYRIGLRPKNNETINLKASSPKDEGDDETYDSGVDMSEEEMISMFQEELGIMNRTMKDGGVCVWWKLRRSTQLGIELA